MEEEFHKMFYVEVINQGKLVLKICHGKMIPEGVAKNCVLKYSKNHICASEIKIKNT